MILFKSKLSLLNRKVKFVPSVMVWGLMSAQGVGSDGCRWQYECWEVPKSPGWPFYSVYQQDGSTFYTDRSSMHFLVDIEVPVIPWPSSSPNLAPIKAFGAMKKHLRKTQALKAKKREDSLKSRLNSAASALSFLLGQVPLKIVSLHSKTVSRSWVFGQHKNICHLAAEIFHIQ